MDDQQFQRYSRHINLPGFGYKAQKALTESHALIIGAGGLGSPAALYLAAAGVGKLTIVDPDSVELSNLQRQIAHTAEAIGQNKAESAQTRCLALNPDLSVTALAAAAEAENLDALVGEADIVLDACDNFPTRYAINRACLKQRKPLVSGAAIRFEGQLTVYRADQEDSACYRCLFNSEQTRAESCSGAGVLAPVVGSIGVLQALEAIKVLTQLGRDLKGRLLLFDSLNHEWTEIKYQKNPACPDCGETA